MGVPGFDQIHDINGGIYPNELFWTVRLPRDSFEMSENGRRARLHVDDVPLIDTFTFPGKPSPIGSLETPATLRLDVEWRATGPAVPRGSGPTPAEAFVGSFAPARAVGTCSGSELGFRFRSNGSASSDDAYAELGRERNGSFL